MLSLRIKASLEIEVGNCIDFANDILKNEKRNKVEPKVNYGLIKYKQMGSYKFFKYIS